MNIEVVKKCTHKINKDFAPHMSRYNCELDWLEENGDQLDRVLHTDAYDVFFQADPFDKLITKDDLIFVVEPHFIRGCGWNLEWFTSCFGKDVTEEFRDNFIICSGTIAGSVHHYIKLIRLMINQTQWETCYGPSKDQPIMNYVVWSGLADAAGIKYRLTGCDGGFMTIQWCVINFEVKYNKLGQILSPSNEVPFYLHQYPRISDLTSYLFDSCEIARH